MKKIKLNEIGNFFNDEVDDLVKLAVLTLDFRIKQNSPVDTGRFRMNWQLTENKDDVPQITGPFNNSKSAIIPPNKINYKKERAGNVYSLINPLPYAEAVCFGTNTPPSWGNQFRSKDGNRSAGWPLKEIDTIVRIIKKAKSKN
tara:strand:+ start:339 stop:770 length:432 start_codon:yes stop_codon:yes gene_type:complete